MATNDSWVTLAARQHGAISRRQLREAGLTSHAVRHAVASGRLAWMSPRVLVVPGAAPTSIQRVWAAALDSTGGVVALQSALAVWGVPGWLLEPVHLLTTRSPHRGGRHLGVVHSTVRLSSDDIGEIDGLLVTTPVRTLVDMAGRMRPGRIADLCDDLLRRRLMTTEQLHGAVADLPRRGGTGGCGLLRQLAAERPVGHRWTDSKLERRFEQVLERAGEPSFERQVDIGDDDGWIGRVDFADRRLKIVVEVQSERFHSSLSDRRRDAARIARLRAAGWVVLEITEEDLFRRPEVVVHQVREVRARARARHRVA